MSEFLPPKMVRMRKGYSTAFFHQNVSCPTSLFSECLGRQSVCCCLGMCKITDARFSTMKHDENKQNNPYTHRDLLECKSW
jgi:hypothetical protein